MPIVLGKLLTQSDLVAQSWSPVSLRFPLRHLFFTNVYPFCLSRAVVLFFFFRICNSATTEVMLVLDLPCFLSELF